MAERPSQRQTTPTEEQNLSSALKKLTANPDPAAIREMFNQLNPEEAKVVKDWAEGLIQSQTANDLSQLSQKAEAMRAVRREALLLFLKEKRKEKVKKTASNTTGRTRLLGFLKSKNKKNRID